jgi:oligosaccharide repeat unit polymerase
LWVASVLLGLLLAGIKMYLVYSIMAAVLVYTTSAGFRLQLVRLAASVLLVLVFFLIYNRTVDVLGPVEFLGSSFPQALSFLEKPYMYVAGSWPALEQVLQGQMPPQPIFGYVTLQPLWKLLGDGLGMIDPVPPYLPYVDIGTSYFNVFSFCGEVFWDYGIIGVVLVSLLFGWLTTKSYLAARFRSFWAHRLIYGLFAYGIVISFFAFYFQFGMLILLLYVSAFAFVGIRLWQARAHRG